MSSSRIGPFERAPPAQGSSSPSEEAAVNKIQIAAAAALSDVPMPPEPPYELIKLGKLPEAEQALSQMPDGPSKLEDLCNLTGEWIKQNRFEDAIRVANTICNKAYRDLALEMIAEGMAGQNRFNEAATDY